MNAINFIKIAAKDYKVGAITVSSRYVADRVAQEVPLGVKNVIEYGAGNGVITKEILKRLPSDGLLVAIESNKHFLLALENIKDKRLHVINKDVVEFLDELQNNEFQFVDAVVSGIPLTLFSSIKRKLVVEGTHNILLNGGVFVVYQYSLLVLPILKKRFCNVKTSFEFRNLPPYFIMTAEK